jgi:cytoskeletal protein RodZ
VKGRDEPRPEVLAAAAGFGRWLMQERELRALTRADVVKLTRLSPALVEALESGDPERMPPKAYVFGYLRAYAGAVGLDADDVVLRWQEVVGPEEPARRARRPVPVKALLAVALLLALAAALAVVLLGPRERAPLKVDRPRAVERAPYAPAPR